MGPVSAARDGECEGEGEGALWNVSEPSSNNTLVLEAGQPERMMDSPVTVVMRRSVAAQPGACGSLVPGSLPRERVDAVSTKTRQGMPSMVHRLAQLAGLQQFR